MQTTSRLMNAIVVALAVAWTGTVQAVDIEPSDLEPDVIAKIAKQKAKRHDATARLNPSGSSDVTVDGGAAGSCGNIDIGNVSTGGGSPFKAPREITVVVTGDVINTGKCRK